MTDTIALRTKESCKEIFPNVFNETGDYLLEVIEFAKKMGQLDSLESQLEKLKRKGEYGYEVHLCGDSAPHSFYFYQKWEGEFAGNGGIIYHGRHDNGGDGGAPTFSVCLTPTSGWSTHT